MTFDELFRRATDRAPFPYQARLAHAESLPDLLAVPTGAGKTAAAVLSWLWRRRFAAPGVRASTPRRLVFCLPMRVLVEQTAAAVRTWLSRLELDADVGVHVLMGGAVDDTWDEDPRADAVLVGTQDQLLSRALNRGYAMARSRWPVHFAWLNNDCLWVMDETQLMGAGLSTSAQLQGLRERLGAHGTITMWMSATLDADRLGTVDFRERALVRLELDGADRAPGPLRDRLDARKPLRPASSAFDEKDLRGLAAEVIAAHRPGTRTLVVVNRVRRAQALSEAVRKANRDVGVHLVHSRFRPLDRRAIEREALSPTYSGILVATQAVEAGVDISAATLFTELASWSAMVQRFGRCNRYGELAAGAAEVRWIDVPDEKGSPYGADDLAFSRARLAELSDVGPEALTNIGEPPRGPNLPVLRRRDLLDLFDTTPDLSGHDLDVSQYIRDADDGSDVQVAWREFPADGPPAESAALHRDELCRVRASELRDAELWRWDTLDGVWRRVRAAVPGNTYLLRTSEGRYDPSLGWTGAKKGDVPMVLAPAVENLDKDEADPDAWRGAYVDLRLHSSDTEAAMARLLERLGDVGTEHALLRRAARWHDLGKVHTVFQRAMVARAPQGDPAHAGGPWAKSDRNRSGRYERSFFRHELASALAALEHGEPDLLCYLVAAHHGKVRTAIRSRPGEKPTGDERLALGILEGDQLDQVDLGGGVVVPPTTLRLDVMEVGEVEGRQTWATRVARLLAQHGPFRLAFLESLVRAADWEASSTRDALVRGEVSNG